MKIEDLDLPEEIVLHLRAGGTGALYPPQEMAVKAGVMEGKSVMVSAPTASGKSLVALLAIISMLKRGGRRAVYLSPLKALAAEKYYEYQKMRGSPAGNPMRPSVSTGDLNSYDRLRGNVLFMTNERMDLALRRGEEWLGEVDLVIADEIHLVGDPFRGPTLEMVLTRLNYDRQVVGLSATITNASEMAQWMDCVLVESRWRPVPLTEGVCDGRTIRWADNTCSDIQPSSRGAAADAALDCIMKGHQALVFVNTRRGAPALAKKTAAAVGRTLDDADREALRKAADRIQGDGGDTQLGAQLADFVRRGAAFHHAGLNPKCRDTVEECFRAGRIKMLAATPTLAAGVNLPARRVVVSSITRYDANFGQNMPISVMEYKQFCGRAGRPQYDDRGEAVVATENPSEVLARYIHGKPEPVSSQIAGKLDIHLLSLIASEPGITLQDVQEFFDYTLGGIQQGIPVGQDLASLERLKMVSTVDGTRYAATEFGELTSRLYLTPETATAFYKAVKKTAARYTLTFLNVMIQSSEFFPTLNLRSKDYDSAYAFLQEHRKQVKQDMYTDDVTRSLMGLYGWISEETEKEISEKYGVESGDTHRMVEMGRWLLGCMSEVAGFAGRDKVRRRLEELRAQVVHGVREELVPLVSIRQVGRVRARALHRSGARSVADVKKMPLGTIQYVCKVGEQTAKTIKAGRT